MSNFKYIIPRPEDKQWGIVVTSSGITHIAANSHYPPSNHPESHNFIWGNGRFLWEYQIVYITRGSGILETANSGVSKIQAGDVFVIHPRIWHRYKPTLDIGWDESWFGFHGEIANRIFKPPFFFDEQPVIRAGINTDLIRLFFELNELLKEEPAPPPPMLISKVMGILACIQDAQNNNPDSITETQRIANKAKAYILKNYTEDIDYKGLAKDLGCSYTSFRRSFKQLNNTSPHQYLQWVRLEHARDHLLHSNKTIQEIAFSCGFTSPFYFSRVFQKKFKLAPSDLRKIN